MFGDAGTVGKPVGEDLREGKFTFLIHHALAGATPAQREALEGALGNPHLSAGEVERAQRLLEETGARAAVTAMVAGRLRDARAALDRIAGANGANGANGAIGATGAAALTAEGRLFFEGLLGYLWERER
jgi:geranylgeranyl pyrophosphate synthase